MADIVTVTTTNDVVAGSTTTDTVQVGYSLPAGAAGAAGGDLAGTFPSPTVTGTHLASPMPLAQGGTGNTTGRPAGTAGGDLSGTYPSPTVAKVGGTALIGIQPSGDTSGSSDTAAIQGLINLGASRIQIGYGHFYLNQPLVIQASGIQLIGSGGATQSGNDAQFGLGTTLTITSGFTNPNSWSSLVTAAIVVIQKNAGTGTGGANPSSNQVASVRLSDFWIDGTSSPASVDGVAGYGAIEAIELRRVGCYKITGKAYPLYSDTSWGSAAFPDGQHYDTVMAQRCYGHAFYGFYEDATLVNCHAQSSNLQGAGFGDGFYFNNGGNARLFGCRSDLNNNGFTMDNPRSVGSNSYNDAITMIGCGTQGNDKNGLNVINSSGTGTSNRVPIILSGCNFDGDGVNGGAGGGGYAGIHVEGRNDVFGSNVNVLTATVFATPNATPAYAITTGTTGSTPGVPSSIRIESGFLNAATGAISDTAPAADFSIGPNVMSYVGGEYNNPTSTPLAAIYSAKLNAAQLGIQGTGASSNTTFGNILKVTQTNSGSSFAGVGLVNQATGDAILGVEVSGDTSQRLRVNGDGSLTWGPGSASGDTRLARATAGQLTLSTSGTGTPKPLDPYFGGLGFLQESSALSMGNVMRGSYTVATAGLTTSGTVYLVAVYMPAGITVSNVSFLTGTTTLKTGGTHGWYVVCTSDGKVRAVSTDQTDAATVWGTASTVYTLPVLTSTSTQYVTPSSGLYYLGIMVANSGGTQPNLVASTTMASGIAGTSGTALSGACTGGTGTSQTTPPTADGSVTLAIASDGSKNFVAWVT